MADEFTFEVDAKHDGVRIDVVLCARVPDMSRKKAKALAADGQVRVGGKRVRKGARVHEGDVVSLATLPQKSDFHARPDPSIPLDVRFENDHLLVVEKPPFVAMHPLVEDELGTLANAIVAHYPALKGVGYHPREPGILHRLDTNTSGLVIVAKTARDFDALRHTLTSGAIDKRYLARVKGVPMCPRIFSGPIRHHGAAMEACFDERAARRENARPAYTELLEVTNARDGESTALVRAPSALRHQVRVHLASYGHPLVGDVLYGGSESPSGRHLLHASYLKFEGPSGQVEVKSAPPDFE